MQKTNVKRKWTGGEVGALVTALIGTLWTFFSVGLFGIIMLLEFITYLLFKDHGLDGSGPATFPDLGGQLVFWGNVPISEDLDVPVWPFVLFGFLMMIGGFVILFILRRRKIHKTDAIREKSSDGGKI